MERCPYYNCKYNCRDISSHKAFYANLKHYKKKKIEIEEDIKPRSSKVNWEVYEKYYKK